MSPIVFQTTNWNSVPVTEHCGERGVALWRTLQFGGIRVRMVEYSRDYVADHWCSAGHIVYCIEGEMTSELADGRVFTLTKGMTYQVSDGMSLHRSHSREGVRLLIIDGSFLSHTKHTVFNPWKM